MNVMVIYSPFTEHNEAEGVANYTKNAHHWREDPDDPKPERCEIKILSPHDPKLGIFFQTQICLEKTKKTKFAQVF